MLLSASKYIGVGIDVTVVAVIVIFALIGLSKGFLKSILSMISTLVVIIASIFLASPCARLLNKIYNFTGWIAGKLCKSISSMGSFYSDPIHNMSGSEVASNIPSGTNGFLKKLMSNVLKPLSANEIEGCTVADIVSGSFASIIMLVACAILMFILIKIVIVFATKLFDNITQNRVFGFTNKLFGGVFGACKGLLVVLIFSFTLTILTVIPKVNNVVSPVIQDNTKITRKIYNFSDEIVGKYVIDGKIIQKWIDNLWENKYKDDGVVDISPNGSLERPFPITLTENTARLSLTFSGETSIYYKLSTSTSIDTTYYSLEIVASGVNVNVYNANNVNDEITDLSLMDNSQDYILKFTKLGTEINVDVDLIVTPI